MSSKVGDFDFYPLQFDKAGKTLKPEQVQAVKDAVDDAALTDLFVVSHGWRNDAADAMTLYQTLFSNASALMAAGRADPARKAAVVGLFWPSKPRYKDYGTLTQPGAQGAVSLGAAVDDAKLQEALEDLKAFLADEPDDVRRAGVANIEQAKALAPALKDSPSARDQFVDLLRSIMTPLAEAQDDPSEVDANALMTMAGRDLLEILKAPVLQPDDAAPAGEALSMGGVSAGGGMGAAAGFGPGDIGAGALKGVDLLSYYEMKERAGIVGKGVAGVLDTIHGLAPNLRIHLIGHSFGARLVTSATKNAQQARPSSIALLQAAFSHNAFSADYKNGKPGFFRAVYGGWPIAITHTKNDKAVGVAYPLASRLAGHTAAAVGDENDIYGGLGRNGAIKMGLGEFDKGTMTPADQPYTFGERKIYNLLADHYIKRADGGDAHGEITNPAVANVVLSVAGF